ncbi:MAG: F0F1 ATP synthase subunit gamma, partial [Bacteroidota bacterium]
MEQAEQLKKKIDSAKDLRSVVKTMKALAAVNIRSLEKAANSLDDYVEIIEMGLHIAMRSGKAQISAREHGHRHRTGIVVFGAGRGMSGRFNAKITDFLIERIDKMNIIPGDRAIITIGDRIRPRLEREGLMTDKVFPIADTIDEIPPLVDELIIEIESWRADRNFDRILLFNNRPKSGASFHPEMTFLMPLNLQWLSELRHKHWDSRSLPTFTMEWEDLF